MTARVPPLSLRREDINDLSKGEQVDRLLRGLNGFGGEAAGLLNGGLTFKANFKAFAKEVLINAQDEWVAITPTAPWTAGSPAPEVSKAGHDVHLRGCLTRNTGTNGSTAFTLPENYRTERADRQVVATDGSSVVASVACATDGTAVISWGASVPTTVYLDGIDLHTENDTGQFNPVFPIRIKNELGVKPSHVFVTNAVDISDGRSEPHSLGNPAWSVSGDQIVIHGMLNVFHGHKYRVTILVVAE